MDSAVPIPVSGKEDSEVSRRGFLKATATAALAASSAQARGATKPDSLSRDNRISRENAKPGALDWQLTRVRLDKQAGFRSPLIEGYCSRQSVKAGESIEIFVSTKPSARALASRAARARNTGLRRFAPARKVTSSSMLR